MSNDLRFCAYYRGVGACSFGCYGPDGPQCMELGRPSPEDLAELEAAGAEVSESFREAAKP